MFIGSNGCLHCVDVDATKIIDKIDVFDDYLLNKTVSATSSQQQQQQQTTNACTNIISIKSSYLKSLSYLVVSLTDTGKLFKIRSRFLFIVLKNCFIKWFSWFEISF